METLSYALMEGRLPPSPSAERVLQFGEGNFLRAFVDYFIDIMNEKVDFDAKVVMVQPIARGLSRQINAQDGLYTLYLRGLSGGQAQEEKRVISCVSRCIDPYEDFGCFLECAKNPHLRFIVSNTTEAGIVFDPQCAFGDAPPHSFPAKLTRFLFERYSLGLPGFIILCCELIDHNGRELLDCVTKYCDLWNLSPAFRSWLTGENLFCDTLVDRIVTGYPKEEAASLTKDNGYEDHLMTAGESFALWVIQGPASLENEFPAARAGLPVLITEDCRPYKERKVRILNGAHTALVPMGTLFGHCIVRNCVNEPILRGFLQRLLEEEIIPTLTLPREDGVRFAAAVLDRFSNPYIDHELSSIALNATSKWQARLLPSLCAYHGQRGCSPPCITAAFAAHIAFCRQNPTQDQDFVREFYQSHQNDSPAELAKAVIRNGNMWGETLVSLAGFEEDVALYLEIIESRGVSAVLKSLLGEV